MICAISRVSSHRIAVRVSIRSRRFRSEDRARNSSFAVETALKRLEMQYKGQYRFGVCNPLIPVGSTVEDAREIARQYVERYKDCNVLVSQNLAYLGTPESDDSLYPVFLDAVYEYSRLAYQDEEE